MLNTFKNFLAESFLVEAAASSELDNDDKGKLHELLLAKYLHPDKQLPTHHRSASEVEGHAGTPQQVHDKLKRKVGSEAYAEVDKAAQSSAKELMAHLKKEGHIHENSQIGDVHWTSNRDTATSKGDHEKTTGVKDVNSNADLILTLKNKKGEVIGYHGVSAKYGTNKEPNYKNPGMESLEKMADLKPGTISQTLAPHHEDMAKLGYTGTVEERHAKYKADTMGIDKVKSEKKRFDTLLATGRKLKRSEHILHDHLNRFAGAYDQAPDKQNFLDQAKRRATMAEESGRASRALVAGKITKGLAKKSDPELRKIIGESVSPPTVIPHTVVHSHINKETGESTPIIKNAEDIGKEHLDKFEGLHVAKDKAGGSVTVRGYDKGTKKLTNVATWGLKSQSGPHKNINGTLQLK